jgi:glutathione S-transferase
MLELYHNDMSTCSQKARLALAEKGLGWTSHPMNLRAGDQHTPDYLALNPNGVVPTLIHDGTPIIESTVINEYLDDQFPQPALRPADAHACVAMRLWTKQLDEGVHAATGVVSSCIAFRFQYFAGGRNEADVIAHIENIPDPAKRERQRENILKGPESKFFPDAVKRFARLLADIEAALAAGDWLVGEAYSLADLNYTPYMVRLDHLQLSWMWDDKPKLAAWYERLRARPNFSLAMTDWLNPDYLTLMKEKGRETTQAIRDILAG